MEFDEILQFLRENLRFSSRLDKIANIIRQKSANISTFVTWGS